MATKITRDVLESYLHCPYKAHLKLVGEQGQPSDYEILRGETRHDGQQRTNYWTSIRTGISSEASA